MGVMCYEKMTIRTGETPVPPGVVNNLLLFIIEDETDEAGVVDVCVFEV